MMWCVVHGCDFSGGRIWWLVAAIAVLAIGIVGALWLDGRRR